MVLLGNLRRDLGKSGSEGQIQARCKVKSFYFRSRTTKSQPPLPDVFETGIPSTPTSKGKSIDGLHAVTGGSERGIEAEGLAGTAKAAW